MGRRRIYHTEAERTLARRLQWRERAERQRIAKKHEYKLTTMVRSVAPPPEHVVAERDVALYAPRTLTAELLGDPPHGRSALDRRGGAA